MPSFPPADRMTACRQQLRRTAMAVGLLLLCLPMAGCFELVLLTRGAAKELNPATRIELSNATEEAAAGDLEAQAKVASWYASRCDSRGYFSAYEWRPDCDANKALQMFTDAAEAGNATAQHALGYIYQRGALGQTEDITRAVQWYRSAGEQGQTSAMSALARIYANGYGVPADKAEAAKWYEKLAASTDTDAANIYQARMIVAEMYATGDGVAQDTAKARAWGVQAAQGGDGYHEKKLATIYAETSPPDYAEAYYWLYLSHIRSQMVGRNHDLSGTYKTRHDKSLAETEAQLATYAAHLTAAQRKEIESRAKAELYRQCQHTRFSDHCIAGE